MSSNSDVTTTIKRYLLAKLEGQQREEFEQLLLTEDELFRELEIVEQELVDEYLAGELSQDEVKMFERHFLATPERQRDLRFGRTLRKYAAARKERDMSTQGRETAAVVRHWPQLFSNPYLRTAVFTSLLVIAGFGVWRIFFFQSEVDKALLALNAAYQNQRPLESRITTFKYAPFITTRGAGSDTVDQNELGRAELELQAARKSRATPAVHHALGKVYLAKKEFDRAIVSFNEALKGDPNNAQIFADLGVGWLEKGRSSLADPPASPSSPDSGKNLEDLGRSLENLNKALQLDSSLSEALFNRALVFEEQKLWNQAADAWNEYLRHDSTSEWAHEAKRKLSELEKRKQAVRRSDAELVNEFIAAYNRGDDDASWKLLRENYTSGGSVIAKHLVKLILGLPDNQENQRDLHTRAFSYLGQLELQRAGDAYHWDLARFYGFLPVAKRKALIKVRDQVDQALQYSTKARTEEAIRLFLTSRQEFENAGNSAEANFVGYQLAQSYLIQPNLKKGQEIYIDLSADCKKREYRWLTGQVLMGLAHISVAQNQYSQAIDFSKESLSVFERCGYVDAIVRTLRQLAEEYQAINRITESLKLLDDSLKIADDYDIDSVSRWGIYLTIAFNLDSLGLLSAAAAYQREALVIALAMQIPLITSRSYAYLGATHAKLKNFSEAVANLTQAYETGANLADDPNGLEMMANSSLELGDLYRAANDPARALDSYDTCLRLYDQLKMPYFNYEAHRGKLLTYVTLRDDSATEHELNTTLDALEEYRDGLNVESQRNSFFENQQTVYDLAIHFAHSRKHDARLAFKYSEQSRARSLLGNLQQPTNVQQGSEPELRSASSSTSMSLTSIKQLMSSDAQLVQYAVLDESSLVWVVSTNDFRVREIPVGKSELAKKVGDYLSVITAPSGDKLKADGFGENLYELLIAPIAPLLSKEKTVVIVPDKSLNYLPFAALRSSQSKRYLIEDYEIEVAPSASIYITASGIAASKKSRDGETLLSVGNPSFDRAAFSNLKDLPSASREAESIRAFYKSGQVLIEGDAREGSIKKLMNNADVVHLAMHYVINQKSEMLSELPLAKEPQPSGDLDGRLRAYEIYQMNLSRTRVAMLSACQTGIDRSFDGEGAVSIARPFLVAGAPVVVATLWPVDSSSTTELMVQFHRNRTAGRQSTVKALRSAQLDLLGNPARGYQQPYYWAPFVVIGGHASF